mmetsp:Transcript_28931/g.32141  ORF Transcript_28931/g.32141 Transcript_28931/m.32141 type:complete len:85 (-) Transcript_28931:121-375(-)
MYLFCCLLTLLKHRQCAHLKAKGGRLCLPDSGEFDETGNTPPLCNKVGQTKEHVYYCTDMRAYQCTAACQSHCYELDATMVFQN